MAYPIDQLQLTSPGGGSIVAPTRASTGPAEPLVVIPRLALDDALRRRAVGSGARFVGRCHVTDVESNASGVLVSGSVAGHAVATARAWNEFDQASPATWAFTAFGALVLVGIVGLYPRQESIRRRGRNQSWREARE